MCISLHNQTQGAAPPRPSLALEPQTSSTVTEAELDTRTKVDCRTRGGAAPWGSPHLHSSRETIMWWPLQPRMHLRAICPTTAV